MERRAKVELFEQIRREYEFGVGTIKGVARKLGVHRRMVRQALADAQPPERKRCERRATGDGTADSLHRRHPGSRSQGAAQAASHRASHLAADLAERPERKVAEVTIRQYVRERKQELGWSTRATCVPQSYELGTGRPGRLVRGVGGVERRAGAAAGLLDAQHGERRGLPSGVSSRDAAGVPRSSRARVRLFWRRLSDSCGTTT